MVEEDDAERRFTFVVSGQSPGWFDGLPARGLGALEDLKGRCALEAFVWPEAEVVGQGELEASFQVVEGECELEAVELGPSLSVLQKRSRRAVALRLPAEAKRWTQPRRLTVFLKAPAVSSAPRSLIRYLGLVKALEARRKSVAISRVPGLESRIRIISGAREWASNTAAM